MIDIVMPQLGESVAEGTVTKWLVREGDFVEHQQPIAVVSTDKADTEVTATETGRIVKLLAAEGETLPAGRAVCTLDETATAGAQPKPQAPAPAPAPSAPEDDVSRPLASPSTRKVARDSGVDLETVTPTGEHGRITHDDVRRAAASQAITKMEPERAPAKVEVQASQASSPSAELAALIAAGGGFVPPVPGVGFGAYKVPPFTAKPGDKVVPFTRRRRITADHMVYSKVTAPHVVTIAEVDLHNVSRLRDAHKGPLKKEGVSLTFLAFVCAAVIKALRETPELNARVLTDSYAVLKDINLGVAVDTPGGLIVPNIKQADQLSLRGIAMAIDSLASKARAGKVTADDLAGTTFTVSNPGLKGNLFGGAIISQPNVGILRMGEIKKRPVVVTRDGEDAIVIHPVMFVALSYDHRVIDGVLANTFLWRVGELLTKGEFEI